MHFKLITDLQAQAHADLHERGLHYGDGLFETMLLQSGRIRLWEMHYQRLSDSARKLHIDCPPRAWLEEALAEFHSLEQDLIIKIILTRGSGGRALEVLPEQKPNLYILHYPYQFNQSIQPISATISGIRLSENAQLAGLKHLNRLDYVLAAQALGEHHQFNEALLCDQHDNVIEGIIHNLFFVNGNTVCTPDLSRCGVQGIARQLVLKTLQQQSRKVTIGDFKQQHVYAASECFLCNSVQGIRPLSRIDNTEFETGPLTRQLQQQFNAFPTD